MEFSTLVPAYGRDYKSRKLLLADWVDGKDFACALSSRYCSSRDFKRNVTVRYKELKRATVLKYNSKTETWS